MEMAITKMSKNGQIVIPSEIRNDAKIGPSTKFLVINKDGDILLRQLKKDEIREDIALMERLISIEESVSKGKFVKANTKMKDKEIDNLLMGD